MTIDLLSLFPELPGAAVLFGDAFYALSSLGDGSNFVLFAQASVVDELKKKLVEVLTIIMLFGFLFGTIRIIGGAGQMNRGETEAGKASIISGALIAAAPLIMRILFEIFFNSGGSLFGA